jgi:DNA-binding SARP family transcriptional activator
MSSFGAAAGDGEAWVSDVRFALPGTLLLSANVPVSSGALAEAVWDGVAPPGAATTLGSHIRRLLDHGLQPVGPG